MLLSAKLFWRYRRLQTLAVLEAEDRLESSSESARDARDPVRDARDLVEAGVGGTTNPSASRV